MKLLVKLLKNIKENMGDYYVTFLLVVALPASIGTLTDIKIAVLSSVLIQSVLGILYLRRNNE